MTSGFNFSRNLQFLMKWTEMRRAAADFEVGDYWGGDVGVEEFLC